MKACAVAREIGVASAIEMCRSIMIKGMEALVIESYATARHHGFESHVLPTLPDLPANRLGAHRRALSGRSSGCDREREGKAVSLRPPQRGYRLYRHRRDTQ
jgi:hypothetical protein